MPDDKSWIKLYRKVKDNDIIVDPTALQLFIWLLTSVDRDTGKVTVGRHSLAMVLRQKSGTIYKAFQRLVKKYKVIDIVSNNRFSTISILKWDVYQSSVTQAVTSGEHQSNNKVTLNKNKRIENKELLSPIIPLNKYSHLEDIHDDDLQDISTNYNVPMYLVKLQHEQLTNYCESSGKKYKNYKSALRNFVLRAASEQMNRQQKGGVLDATNL